MRLKIQVCVKTKDLYITEGLSITFYFALNQLF